MIYSRCLNCGGPLPELPVAEGWRRYLVPALTLLVVLIVVMVVIVPAIHFSMTGGQVLSTAIGAITATPTPLPQYQIGQPVRSGDLQVTVTDAHAVNNQFNGKQFFIVTVSLQNYNANDTYTLSSADFVLADSGGTYYSPVDIQSKTSYALSPGTTGIATVDYILPLTTGHLRMLYMFPAATAAPGKDRTEVSFTL